jgi:hypothetical protein
MGFSSVFRSKYPLRRYGEQKYINGYACSGSTDIVVELDVQELNEKQLQNLPEGKRSYRHIKTFGDFKIQTADAQNGTPADRLFYDGRWWECEESIYRPHTILAHCRAQFVMLSESDTIPDVPDMEEIENDD